MSDRSETLTQHQLDALQLVLSHGADQASDSLGRWIDRPTTISFDSIEQLPIERATSVLGESDAPVCFCMTEMHGRIRGRLILAFDDASGLALADMLLGQPRGTAGEWGELETSAALETTNIVCCAYLNAVLRALPNPHGEADELIPSPPQFSRDFAESLIQFALMDQIVMSDNVLLARTAFHIDGAPVNWSLLLVPDVEAMRQLGRALRSEDGEHVQADVP